MRECVSCERAVCGRVGGACSFMWESMRGVITLCEVVGGAKQCVFGMGMKKHPLYRVGTGGVWLGIVMRVRALRGWCGGRWSLRTFRR